MEEKPHNFKASKNQLKLKSLLIEKHNQETVTSSDNNKVSEEKKEESQPSQKVEETRPNSRTTTPARSSPEPSCAICLEQLQNKSFTDSCFHTFCFTCLVEWSKVKAECPLCKQRFNSIVHNVRSNDDYDQYYIKTRSSESATFLFASDRRFRYTTTLTPERVIERNRLDSIESQMASHRMRFAPHSVRIYSQSQMISRLPCGYRRRIYDQDLWVKTMTGERVRYISPEFYRANPACTHRLLPWLNRELGALLQNNETQITFVMELIMALIMRYEIRSEEFYLHIEPYLSPHTGHFVHEFHNFAISPYDMENYDRHAVYTNSIRTRYPSSDGDVIVLSNNVNGTCDTQVLQFTHREPSETSRSSLQVYKRLKKLVIKRNSESNSWETVVSSVPSYRTHPIQHIFTGPSTSGMNQTRAHAEPPAFVFPSPQYIESSDDDVQIIDVVKPRSQRTPEIIDLLSDEDNVVTVSSGNDSDSIGPLSTPDVCDAEHAEVSNSGLQNDNSANSDIECVYYDKVSSNTDDNGARTEHSLDNTSLDTTSEIENENLKLSSPNRVAPKNHVPVPKKHKYLPMSVVGTWSTDTESSSIWQSPHKKRKQEDLSSTDLEHSSTESSDVEQTASRSSKSKKWKLRSVVAHFSYDKEHDSGRHSSHKRRKEKKKKKKKHSHKHKRRIYSDDSD